MYAEVVRYLPNISSTKYAITAVKSSFETRSGLLCEMARLFMKVAIGVVGVTVMRLHNLAPWTYKKVSCRS